MRTAVRNCVSFNYGEFNARPVDWRTGSATGASRPATLHMAVALHAAGLSHSEQKRQTERRLNCQQICRQWFSGWRQHFTPATSLTSTAEPSTEVPSSTDVTSTSTPLPAQMEATALHFQLSDGEDDAGEDDTVAEGEGTHGRLTGIPDPTPNTAP